MDGDTLQRAGVEAVRKHLRDLANQGQSADANAAVGIFLMAMRAGMHSDAPLLLELVDSTIAADPEFASVCTALRRLDLVWRALDVLG